MREENPVILKDYTFIKDIGEGNFGKVKLSILNSTKEKYAIKILDKEKLKSQTKSTLFNEIEILSRLKHPNIIYVDKILEDEKNYYIIMEYCEKGELFDYIVEKEKLNPIEASVLFYQLINGVNYIHKQGFAHRDLKPENLLLTKEKILKIIDFGLCHDYSQKKFLKTKCGSPSYAAPEILKGFPYDGFKTDIWCCGIILYAMLCGYLPFDGDDNQEIFQSIVECEPEFPNFLEDDSINLLIWLLNPEPKDRITIEEIMSHPFYLKGKYFYSVEYEESEDISEEYKNNKMRNNYMCNYKNIGFSTTKRKKGNIYTFNNIKRLKMNNNLHFKNNIYQKIFNNINNLNDEEQNINKNKNSKEYPYLLTSFNNDNKQSTNETENTDKNDKLNINIIELNNNSNKNQQNLIAEGNQDRIGKNKFIGNNNLQSNHIYKAKSQEKKTNTINDINENSLETNKFNQYKSLDIKNRKLNINHNNQFLSEKLKNSLKNKNIEKQNNIKDKKLNPQQLDFFQKFNINQKKADSIEKSPMKNIGINCNLILTKNKEKNKNNNEEINKNGEQKESFGNKNKVSIKDKIILSQKRKNYNSVKKEPNNIFNNKINIIGSPAQNINNYYQGKNKKNKFLNSIFGYNNNKNEIINVKSTEVNMDKMNFGFQSYSIKKNPRRKNLKIDLNKNLNSLKITNLNGQSNTIKKEARNNNFILNNHQEININNNLLSLNIVLKTEPKNNHFLDKVLQKINSNRDRNSFKNKNILMLHNDNKNDKNRQILRFLSIEKNNNHHDYMGNPFLIKYYKNNENDEDKINKKSTFHLKEDAYLLHTINQKIDNTINRKSNDKVKKIFPNLMIFGKNKS